MAELQAQDGPEEPTDPLVALRTELDELDEVAVEDRVALFERVNDTLATELAALDEV